MKADKYEEQNGETLKHIGTIRMNNYECLKRSLNLDANLKLATRSLDCDEVTDSSPVYYVQKCH